MSAPLLFALILQIIIYYISILYNITYYTFISRVYVHNSYI